MRVVEAALFLTAIASGADYVGSEACKTCHAPVWNQFFRNPHYKSIASGTETPENTGCESCHGPGKAHIEARGGKATIVAFSEIGPEKTLDACLRCHSQTISRANIRRSVHTQEDVVCSNCHSIHNSKSPKFLLAKKQTELCYSCHTAGEGAVLDAFQASRERRSHGVHGLPQSSRHVRGLLAHGRASAHGGSERGK